ncbi:MAG: hypothetical protein KF861_09100 [Planctomycetaceae bacterium]|nr:hypothetical protein [Planctomycetaceae bacterium]
MTTSIGTPVAVKAPVSLWELASREADHFKWIESERSGYDVGRLAHVEWSRRYWRAFCRYRRMEHLLGERRIREFDDASFGRLRDPELCRRPVVRFVIKQFVDEGWENLDFLLWAPHHGFELQELHEALSLVDVNAARFDPPRW